MRNQRVRADGAGLLAECRVPSSAPSKTRRAGAVTYTEATAGTDCPDAWETPPT